VRARRLLEIEADPSREYKGFKNDFQSKLKEIDDDEDEQQRESKKQKKDKSRGNIDTSTPSGQILAYLKQLLAEWESELDSRPDAVKRSAQGKRTLATFRQSRDYLKPLFHRLKHQTLQQSILDHLIEIVEFVKQREYVRANDVYLQMAIGNAPWPIGVTMVGIHERSAREKISSNQIAHVLNDETQRKFIQSVKRLMTFAQAKYPADPSRSMG
jgi:pre-mRNA-splicing factor 18